MSAFARVLGLCRPYAGWIAAGAALNTMVVLSNVALLALSGWFVAAMALSGLRHVPIEYFAPAAAIRGLAVLRTAGRYAERVVGHEATFRLIAELRVWLYRRLEPLAPAGLRSHRGGDLLSRLRADVDSLDNLTLRVLSPAAAALAGSALLVGFLALHDAAVAAIAAGGLVLVGAILPGCAFALGRAPGRDAVLLRGRLRAGIADGVRGLGELLVAGEGERHAERLAALSRALVATQRRRAAIDAGAAALALLASQGAAWAALLAAIPATRAHALSGPQLAMVVLAVLAGFEAVSPLAAAFQAQGETMAAARRVFELADAPSAIPAEPPCVPARAPTRFDLRLRDVRLRYEADRAPALDGIDLAVPQGGSVGIVGPSGAGKTSILNVLLRFWPFEGEVLVGGVPLEALGGDAMRAMCAVVEQRTHLFDASVRDNLRLARPDASDAEIADALGRAGLADEIAALPDGLDTMAGENGARFSGGQARRLSIARAMLRDAPILLLDEPTEGLDGATEQAVLDALATLARGRTTLLITHREAALRIVDRVVALDRGRIVSAQRAAGRRARRELARGPA